MSTGQDIDHDLMSKIGQARGVFPCPIVSVAFDIGFAGKPEHSSKPRLERVHASEYRNSLHFLVFSERYVAASRSEPTSVSADNPRLRACITHINIQIVISIASGH